MPFTIRDPISPWRNSLREGSFRGVPFETFVSQAKIGRRTVTHEFPSQDDPFGEDLGRRARRFRFDAFIIGPDYMVARDQMITAIEQEGLGPLIHPYWGGPFQVQLDGEVDITESTREGGMAKFAFNFVQIGIAKAPTTKPSPPDRTKLNALLAAQSLASFAQKAIRTGKLIGALKNNVLNKLNTATSGMRKARGKIQASLNVASDISQAIDNFVDESGQLLDTPGKMTNQFVALMQGIYGLVRVAQDTADTVLSVVGSTDDPDQVNVGDPNVQQVIQDAERRVRTLLQNGSIFDDEADQPDDTSDETEQRRIEAEALAGVGLVARASSIIALSEVAVDLQFDSANLVNEVRDDLADRIDALMDEGDDDLFTNLNDLRSALVDHLNTVAQSLPEVSEFTPPRTIPALVLAYQLFGDADQESDIIARNKVRNPNKVPGSVPLEVLTSG